jgi:hypothetical protein
VSEPTTETNELFARRHLGRATGEDLIAWAAAMLEAGSEARNVGILAGLTAHEADEAAEYFARSLRELGWSEPGRRESLLWYARESAARTLRGELTPFEGCGRVYEVARALNYPRELSGWQCLALGHDPETFDDLEGEQYEAAVRREAARLLGQLT